MHAEERILNGAPAPMSEASGLDMEDPAPTPLPAALERWNLRPTSYPTSFDLRTMRAVRSANEEQSLLMALPAY